MEIIGIICEYNPFHNGHLYHINEIKKLYPNSIILLVLNGYFLERGEISILSKEDKTKISLENGIDIVLELPFIFGTQSADTFAECSLKILNNFKINKLIFGSESNDITLLTNIAKKQFSNDFNQNVKKYLDEGINYPTALAKSLSINNFNFSPNDLLGISYIKSIIKNNYNIDAISIKRSNDYHDIESNDSIISASNIREKIKNNINIEKFTPKNIINKIINVNYNEYFNLLKYKINTDNNLNNYLDVNEGIEYRLKKYINCSKNTDEFIKKIKTKRYTFNKINRMFIHILLSMNKNTNYKLEYIKILGFSNNGKKYLNTLKEIEITTKTNKESLQYEFEIKASILFDLINNTNTYEFETKNKPIIKE